MRPEINLKSSITIGSISDRSFISMYFKTKAAFKQLSTSTNEEREISKNLFFSSFDFLAQPSVRLFEMDNVALFIWLIKL